MQKKHLALSWLKEHWAIIGLILLMAGVKIFYMATYYHLLAWDEAVFVSMGKYLASDGTSGLWEEIRPPGLPALLAFPQLLGMNGTYSGDFLMLGFTIACVIYTYLIGREAFGKVTGILAATLMAATPFFFLNSMMIMTDVPAAALCVAAAYHAMKRQYIASGSFAILAAMIRYPAGIIAIALLLAIAFKENIRHLTKQKKMILRKYLLPFFIGLAALLAINMLLNGAPVKPILLASLHQAKVVDAGTGLAGLLFYPAALISAFPAAIFLLAYRPRKEDVFFLIPAILFLMYFMAIYNKQERFAVLFLPFIAIAATCGMTRLIRSRAALSVIVLVLLIPPLHADAKLFTVRFVPSEPEFVKDYFMLFDGEEGSILTADPVPAAYSNNLFIPYYNNIDEAMMIYDLKKDSSMAIIYDRDSFPCNEESCEQKRDALEREIEKDGILVYNKTWWGFNKQAYILNQ